MTRRKKMLTASILVFLLIFAFLGLAMPEIIRRQSIDWVNQNTERQLAIEDVSFNPLNGQLSVYGLSFSEAGSEESFVSFDRLVINVNISSVWRLSPIIDRLELHGPTVRIVKLELNKFNFSDLLELGGSEEATTSTTEAEPLQFAVNNIIVSGGTIDFIDLKKSEIEHTIRELELALPFVGNTPALTDKFVQPRLSLVVDEAPFAISGEAKPFADTLEASLKIKLDNIDLPFYMAYLPKERPVDLESGKLAVDLELQYRFPQDGKATLQMSGDITLTSVSVLDKLAEKVFFLPLAQVSIAPADLLAEQVVIDQVALYGLEIFVNRDASGEWNHARLAKEGTPPAVEPEEAVVEETEEASVAAEEAVGPHLQLKAFRLRNGVIHFRDDSGTRPFVREVVDVNIDLTGFDNLSTSLFPLAVSLRIEDQLPGRSGTVNIVGQVGINPPQVESDIDIDRIQLAGIESYFPPDFQGQLAGGNVDAAMHLSLEMQDQPMVSLTGTTGLRALRLVEPVDNSEVLQWESFQLDGLDVSVAGNAPTIRIAELTLNNYLAKILVTAEGAVNLQHMVTAQGDESQQPPVISTPSEEPAGGEAPPLITIDRVTLQGGTLEFADQHIPKTFKAKFLNLGGRISGIDSTGAEPATVDLRGNLENRSPLIITGAIRPLGEKLYADLKIRFDAIELTPMTPYSGNYVGYAIEKGKLYLDLDYKVDGNQLNAANHVFIDQFNFGQKVESEEATTLPVRLAVALLKDRRGEIHLDLPVSGDLDDPEFSVVGVVFTILKNLLVKAATAPFKLLAAMLGGGGGEDFSTISFPYGTIGLEELERSKLEKLKEALVQRPALKLEVSGYVDREQDPEGLRRVRLENALRELQFYALKRAGKLPEGATVDAVSLSEEERSLYLKQVYKDADFPKPRNAFGFVKSLPDAEMEKLILANTEAGEEQMQQLADGRAKTVYDYLVQELQMPVERVFLKQDDIYAAPEEGAGGNRVGFGVAID